MIKLSNLNKYYKNGKNKVKVLEHINLEIKDSELVAIVGNSGSGKSTLLNILSGMTEISEGDYYFNGQLMNKIKEKEFSKFRNEYIGYIVQDYALIKDISVYDNVKIPTLYKKGSKSKKDAEILSALEKVGLLNKKDSIVNEISGGECQRVAIARSILNDKSIILADEPTGALDEKTGNNIIELLFSLNKIGKTLIIVTHNKEIANRCNRIIELKDGKIIKDYLAI